MKSIAVLCRNNRLFKHLIQFELPIDNEIKYRYINSMEDVRRRDWDGYILYHGWEETRDCFIILERFKETKVKEHKI